MALLTAVPMAPEEPSMRSKAGESLSKRRTTPSAARILSVRPTFLISETASLIRLLAGCDFQPKACRRKRATTCDVQPLASWLSIYFLDPFINCPCRADVRTGSHLY